MSRRRRRDTPERTVWKLQMLNVGDVEAAVLPVLEVAQSTYGRWRKQDGGIES